MEKINYEHPECYTQNDGVYPLCKGSVMPEYDCKKCCLYEEMDENPNGE